MLVSLSHGITLFGWLLRGKNDDEACCLHVQSTRLVKNGFWIKSFNFFNSQSFLNIPFTWHHTIWVTLKEVKMMMRLVVSMFKVRGLLKMVFGLKVSIFFNSQSFLNIPFTWHQTIWVLASLCLYKYSHSVLVSHTLH